MSPQAKEEYFEVLYKRYKEASRKEKTVIISECCAVCGCHRKHAIRRLRGHKRFTKPKAKKRGKPSVYNKEAIIRPLKQIWLVPKDSKPFYPCGCPNTVNITANWQKM